MFRDTNQQNLTPSKEEFDMLVTADEVRKKELATFSNRLIKMDTPFISFAQTMVMSN